MGTLRIDVEIENPADPGRRETLRLVRVDTGAELSWFPARVLDSLSATDDVVFGDPGDRVLLGARSLAGLNLCVDPVSAPDARVANGAPVLDTTAFRRRRGPMRRCGGFYRAALARGGTAGRFAPSSRPSSPDADAERARIMTFHEAAVDELRAALSSWAEPALDRCRLPHPLMGRLTVREMLLFTLYHNSHHVEHVRRRRSARETPGAAGR